MKLKVNIISTIVLIIEMLKLNMHMWAYLKVDFELTSSGHSQTECGCIDASITLTKNEKLILGEIWELGKKALQSQVIVICHLQEKIYYGIKISLSLWDILLRDYGLCFIVFMVCECL